jgi:hypothetical protein
VCLGLSKSQNVENIFATTAVISLLENEFSSDSDQWELIVNKAKRWLSSQSTTHLGEDNLNEWLEFFESFI